MTQEILAKIMRIIAKTGDRVIVVDPATGAPFALMNLDEYEQLVGSSQKGAQKEANYEPLTAPLTTSQGSGIIDPDFTPWKTPVQSVEAAPPAAEVEEDRYYMEPTE